MGVVGSLRWLIPVQIGAYLGYLTFGFIADRFGRRPTFIAFMLVQLRYLFGGAAHVATTAGVSYAEYARSGFFELVWVTVLVLPLLLVADAVLRPGSRAAQLTFRVLAAALLLLLGVVMLSAMQRMWLYQRAYGLTDTRLYASAAMAWLALVFAWFAASAASAVAAPPDTSASATMASTRSSVGPKPSVLGSDEITGGSPGGCARASGAPATLARAAGPLAGPNPSRVPRSTQ